MKDFIEYYLDELAWKDYQDACGESNRLSIETMKSILPMVIERELTAEQQDCVRLHYFEELTQAEIAGKLGITQSTVSRVLKTARKRVGRILKYSLQAAGKTFSVF